MVPGFLDQILDNLLANVLEATPAGRAVRVHASNTGGMVEIHVVDEGRGMAEEERRRAFDRFWRGAGSAGAQGPGWASRSSDSSPGRAVPRPSCARPPEAASTPWCGSPLPAWATGRWPLPASEAVRPSVRVRPWGSV